MEMETRDNPRPSHQPFSLDTYVHHHHALAGSCYAASLLTSNYNHALARLSGKATGEPACVLARAGCERIACRVC